MLEALFAIVVLLAGALGVTKFRATSRDLAAQKREVEAQRKMDALEAEALAKLRKNQQEFNERAGVDPATPTDFESRR